MSVDQYYCFWKWFLRGLLLSFRGTFALTSRNMFEVVVVVVVVAVVVLAGVVVAGVVGAGVGVGVGVAVAVAVAVAAAAAVEVAVAVARMQKPTPSLGRGVCHGLQTTELLSRRLSRNFIGSFALNLL